MPNRLYACHVYEKNEKQEFDLYCIIRLLYVYRVGRHRYHYTPACQKGSVGGKRSRFTVKSLVNTHQRVVEGEEAKPSQGEINSMVFFFCAEKYKRENGKRNEHKRETQSHYLVGGCSGESDTYYISDAR
jgi:hypothetical protein